MLFRSLLRRAVRPGVGVDPAARALLDVVVAHGRGGVERRLDLLPRRLDEEGRARVGVRRRRGVVDPHPGVAVRLQLHAQIDMAGRGHADANAQAFTADGFLRTGDLGRLTLTGELVITGRAKEIIVLASGENIDPTNIEATLSVFPFVQDAVLVGQDKKGLGALIVPDLEKLREFVREKYNQVLGETEEALRDKQLLDRLREEMNKLLNAKKEMLTCP